MSKKNHIAVGGSSPTVEPLCCNVRPRFTYPLWDLNECQWILFWSFLVALPRLRGWLPNVEIILKEIQVHAHELVGVCWINKLHVHILIAQLIAAAAALPQPCRSAAVHSVVNPLCSIALYLSW
jgi:hypothetical protein